MLEAKVCNILHQVVISNFSMGRSMTQWLSPHNQCSWTTLALIFRRVIKMQPPYPIPELMTASWGSAKEVTCVEAAWSLSDLPLATAPGGLTRI